MLFITLSRSISNTVILGGISQLVSQIFDFLQQKAEVNSTQEYIQLNKLVILTVLAN